MQKIKEIINDRTIIRSWGVAVLAVVVMAIMVLSSSRVAKQDKIGTTDSEATQNTQLVKSAIDVENSVVVTEGGVSRIELSSENLDTAILESSEKNSVSASYDLLKKLEHVGIPKDLDVTSSDKSNAILGAQTVSSVLPENFAETATITRMLDTQKFYNFDLRTDKKHVYLKQNIPIGTGASAKDVPVLGSSVRMDFVDENKLVGLGAHVVQNTNYVSGYTDLSYAIQTAIEEARVDGFSPVRICSDSNKIFSTIVNLKLLGFSDDATNYLTYEIPLCSATRETEFKTRYYVSLKEGEVLFVESEVFSAISRIVKDCSSGSCKVVRNEGSQASGIKDADDSYNILGRIYNFFFNEFGRDGYDGRGSTVTALVNYPSSRNFSCPNAAWSNGTMAACRGMVADDVWAHEYTHGVTMTTAGLQYSYASGAVNESMSDIFAYGVDPDWEMGEDTVLGSIRSIKDPPRSKKPQPDRLFSSHFYCTTGNPSQSNDFGGVHVNNGILNKAFYLLVEGGSFNGCTIQPIGREAAHKVIYKALTSYLGRTSNFSDTYAKINMACDEVYGGDSGECVNIKAALQAVEVDQQASGTQYGPLCTRQARKEPACATVTLPTTQPTQPPIQQPTNRPLPTNEPPPIGGEGGLREIQYTGSCIGAHTSTDTNIKFKTGSYICFDGVTGIVGDGQTCYSREELQSMANIACQAGAVPTDEPIPTPDISPDEFYPTLGPSDDPHPPTSPYPTQTEGNMQLDIALRFQGITRRPNAPYDTMIVRIGLVGRHSEDVQYAYVEFFADGGGVWQGVGQFNAPAGEYYVLVKGPMHMQSKVCHTAPYESYEGTYRCDRQWISLEEGENELDFSGMYQMSGDLPSQYEGQDGVSNSFDVYMVRYNIGSRDPEVLPYCDINRDGVCNTQDYALLLSSYAIKLDDE